MTDRYLECRTSRLKNLSITFTRVRIAHHFCCVRKMPIMENITHLVISFREAGSKDYRAFYNLLLHVEKLPNFREMDVWMDVPGLSIAEFLLTIGHTYHDSGVLSKITFDVPIDVDEVLEVEKYYPQVKIRKRGFVRLPPNFTPSLRLPGSLLRPI